MTKQDFQSLALVLLLAACLRFAGITFDSLWLDESYQSLVEATGQPLPDFMAPASQPFLFRLDGPRPLAEVLSRFRSVDPLCPPLYAVILNRWMSLFSASDLSVRLLSATFSLASIAVVYATAARFFGKGAALNAALIQALSPLDIIYAQEARMYTLQVLASALSSGSLVFFLSRIKHGWRDALTLAVYSLSTWALINSHYTGLFIVAFQGVFSVLYCLAKRRVGALLCLGLAWSATVLLWLPWFAMFRQSASVRTASFYVAREPTLWWPLWALVARIPYNWMCFLEGKRVVLFAIPLYLSSAFMIALSIAFSLVDSGSRQARRVAARFLPGAPVPNASRLAHAFFWGWALLPALAVWLLDVIEHHRVIEISRYLIASAPAIYVLAGAGVAWFGSICASKHGRQLRNPAGWLLVAHAAFALINNLYAHVVPQREPWRQMAALVESSCAQSDLIVVSQFYNIICLDRYLTRPMIQVGTTPALGPQHIASLVAGRRRFWLLTAQEGESVAAMVPQAFKLRQKIDLHHALHLRLYEID